MSARRHWRAIIVLGPLLWACSRDIPPTTTEDIMQGADQLLFGMFTVITSEGVRRAHVYADTAYMFDANQIADLRSVRVVFYSTVSSDTTVLTSTAGQYEFRTEDMEARGNVVVVRTGGRRLETERLRYDRRRNEISSDDPFLFVEPGRRLEGVGFVSDPDFRNIRSREVRGPAGQVRIPSQ
jgi:LPS export ABC transporter protein LptC